MALSYAQTTRNVDHTKFVALKLSFSSELSSTLLVTSVCLLGSSQVRRRACDQHPKGDEYRGDRSQAQTCSELHCLYVGPQVFWGFLGWDEGVSFRSFPVVNELRAVGLLLRCDTGNMEESDIWTSFMVMRTRLTFGSLTAGNPSLLMKYRPSRH